MKIFKIIIAAILGLFVLAGIIYIWLVEPFIDFSKGDILPLITLVGVFEFIIFRLVLSSIENDWDDEEDESNKWIQPTMICSIVIPFCCFGLFAFLEEILGIDPGSWLEKIGIVFAVLMGVGIFWLISFLAFHHFKPQWGYKKQTIMGLITSVFLFADAFLIGMTK